MFPVRAAVDYAAEVQREATRLHYNIADSDVRTHMMICQLKGMFADDLAWNRKWHNTTLEEALAKIDKTQHALGNSPKLQAIVAVQRQLARTVYAHPRWTERDAGLYAMHECLRATPDVRRQVVAPESDDLDRFAQSLCVADGVYAASVVTGQEEQLTLDDALLKVGQSIAKVAETDPASATPWQYGQRLAAVTRTVYANPTWTSGEAQQRVEQDCRKRFRSLCQRR